MVVGVTLRREFVDGKIIWQLNNRYIKFYVDKGCEVLFITPYNLSFLEGCDAIIITGGYDLNPNLYDCENICSNNVDNIIDELDLKVIDYAYKNNIPLLGICRGIQSINVYLGGSLNQDIENHMFVEHNIIKVNDSRIALDLPDVFLCNSYHHQSIGKLGKDLTPLYLSRDNCVEMFEHKFKKIYACQFHPEMDLNNTQYINILNYLIKK